VKRDFLLYTDGWIKDSIQHCVRDGGCQFQYQVVSVQPGVLSNRRCISDIHRLQHSCREEFLSMSCVIHSQRTPNDHPLAASPSAVELRCGVLCRWPKVARALARRGVRHRCTDCYLIAGRDGRARFDARHFRRSCGATFMPQIESVLDAPPLTVPRFVMGLLIAAPFLCWR
jgi:hypothetical protein